MVRANQAACDALGYTREEFAHLRVFDFDPLYQTEAWKQIWEKIAREKYVVIESIHRRKDGSTFPVEIASTFFEYEGKKLIHSFARDISERKRSEIAIRESEAKYRTLFEKSKDAMLIIDNNVFTDCNASALAMLGISKDGFFRLHPSRISPPQQPDGRDSQEKAEEMMAVALREGSHRFEWVHCRANGDLFWAEVSLTAIPIGGRLILHTVWREITERKKAEEELQAAYEQITASEEELRENYDELSKNEQRLRVSEAFFRALFDQASQLTGVLDPEGNLIRVNNTALSFISTDLVSVLHRPFWETPWWIHDPALQEQVRNAVVRARNGEMVRFEVTHKDRDGKLRQIDFSIKPIVDDNGSVIALLPEGRDITESKQAAEEIAFKNLLLTTQQETSPDAILIVDDNAQIIHYNRKFIDTLNIPRELLTSQSDDAGLQYIIGQIADPESFLSRIRYLYEHKQEKGFDEILLKDGRILERFSAPMLGGEGRYYGRVWYFRDITERKQAEAALRSSDERFRTIAETIPGVLYQFYARKNGEMGIHYVSERAQDLFGISGDPLTFFGRFTDCVAPEARKGFLSSIERAVRERKSWDFRGRFIRTDGREMFFRGLSEPVPAGDELVFHGMLLDITAEEQAGRALKYEQEFTRLLLDTSPAYIVAIRSDGRTLTMNKALLEALEYTIEEIEGVDYLSTFVPEEDRALLASVFHQVIYDGKATVNENRIVSKSKKVYRVEWHGRTVTSDERKPGFFVGVGIDITNRR